MSTLSSPTACPADKNGDSGHLINHLYKYQCAYAAGACTWDGVSAPLHFGAIMIADPFHTFHRMATW